MVKLVMLAVDGDPVFLSPVIRPTASSIRHISVSDGGELTPGQGIRFPTRLSVKG
jgi:hypothetical protein